MQKKEFDSVQINAAKKNEGREFEIKDIVAIIVAKLEICHSEEIEVAKVISYPKKFEQRKKGFTEITRVGDFYHNCAVLSTQRGELIHRKKFVLLPITTL